MAGLQRSEVSFRRQGSSGLVWDDKVLSGELNRLADQQKQDKNKRLTKGDDAASRPAELTIDRSRSNATRTGRVPPAVEPPSPKVSACGLCGAFGRNNQTRHRPPKSRKRVA